MKDYLRYHWWKYVGIALIFTGLWCYIFSAIARPGRDERVNILYIGTHLHIQQLESQLTEAMPELTQQQIESIRVDSSLPDVLPYHLLLSTRVMEYDILIIEEPYLEENTGQSHFTRSSKSLQPYFPQAEPYYEEIDGHKLIFGFIAGDESLLSDYYTGENRCYLFASPESVNFDTLYGDGEPGNDAALKTAQYLLSPAE